MRASMSAAVAMVVAMVVALVAGACAEKQCPPVPDPGGGTGTGPGTGIAVDAGADEYKGYEFRLVEKDGKIGFVATSSKGRIVVIPLDPRTRMFADGKVGTAGELLSTAMSSGGCPCRLQSCWPYCRVAGATLSLSDLEFWGSADVPKWNLPEVPTPPGGAIPTE